MRKYPEYKSSGVEWIDDVPIGWNIAKLKFIANNLNRRRVPLEEQVRRDMTNKEFDYYGATGIIDKVEKFLFDETTILIAEDGANLISRNIQLIYIATGKYWVNNHAHILKPKANCLLDFLALRLECFDYSNLIRGAAQPKLTKEDLMNICLPIPPFPEQLSMVRFLDYKTGQIDRFIANRQKQIELLKEQFKKKIFTALTKGLSNKVFKPTNLPWFPEIPKDWDLYKFNAAIKLHHGFQFRDNHFKEEGVKVVKITQLKADGTLDLSEASFVEEKFLPVLKDRIIKNGDILMALTGGTIGKIICVDDLQEEVLQNYRVGKFVPKDSKFLDKDFMFWILSSDFTYAQILFLQRETGQPNIGISDFSKMFFPMPNTLEEQREISAYIIEQKTETDTLISKYQKQIDLMQEYRSSLISQAVTGKIDVREWKPKARKYQMEELPISIAAEN